jgi:hypothetical protein
MCQLTKISKLNLFIFTILSRSVNYKFYQDINFINLHVIVCIEILVNEEFLRISVAILSACSHCSWKSDAHNFWLLTLLFLPLKFVVLVCVRCLQYIFCYLKILLLVFVSTCNLSTWLSAVFSLYFGDLAQNYSYIIMIINIMSGDGEVTLSCQFSILCFLLCFCQTYETMLQCSEKVVEYKIQPCHFGTVMSPSIAIFHLACNYQNTFLYYRSKCSQLTLTMVHQLLLPYVFTLPWTSTNMASTGSWTRRCD